MLCCAPAGDARQFRLLASAKKVPPPSSITYEGLFNEHWFLYHDEKDSGSSSGSSSSSTSESTSESKNFLITPVGGYTTYVASEDAKKRRQLVTCFLRSPLDGKERTLGLNLVIALDISGSMSESMTTPKTEEDLFRMKTKLQLAQSAINEIIEKLRDGDRFGLVTFNETAHVVQDIAEISKLDKKNLKALVAKTKAGGGTVLISAVEAANKMISQIKSEIDIVTEETRVIFVTDMCDSSSDTKGSDALLSSIRKNADQGIFTSVIGVGIDFNTQVTQKITKVKGANYMSCFTEEEFLSTLSRNFSFNYFPFAFDIQLRMSATGTKGEPYTITDVYGTPFVETAAAPICDTWTPATHTLYPKSFRAVVTTFLLCMHRRKFQSLPAVILSKVLSFINPANCCLVEINTSFPSEVTKNRIYGGAILVAIEKAKENDQHQSDSVVAKLRVTYTDRAGKEQGNEVSLTFNVPPAKESGSTDFYSSFPVHKAALLQRYVQNTQQFLTAHQDRENTESHKARLAAFSAIFTEEAAASRDEELIKTAGECAKFVADYCKVTPAKRGRTGMTNPMEDDYV